ncbi:aldose 1-epimerase family protein [Bifidobacterium cuniculi]|uniref:Aldose 1-epimerase n=1 Tax=Bifidobacterium cuniculi TaxID=1688 RepID=A0A087B3I9_9BIFI|nr:aldose 1-epimerase family protein [Bifidobacterium cuniculi]KFI65589.1 aldose 1-epimerase [Bifidobacterium cuniculi]
MTPHLPARTGQQFTVVHGDYLATVTELGATLRVLRHQGRDLIVSLEPDQVVNCCQGQLLVPFPNRIEAGRYTFEGIDYQLPVNEPDRGNAIHGLGRDQYWHLDMLGEDTVTLSWRVPPFEGYPFDLTVTATYLLDDDGLHMTVTAHNNGTAAAPWALAIHPWLANGMDGYGDEIDAMNAQCSLQLPARTHVQVNDNLIPVGTEPVDGTKYDFRTLRTLDEQPYDDAFTDLEHESDGTVSALFVRPDGLRVRVGGDATVTSFQVCTGTGFPAPKHPSGVAVEPQTAYANAFRSGDDLIVIAPGTESVTQLFLSVDQED